MSEYSYCPCCHDPLNNSYAKDTLFSQRCEKRLDHSFICFIIDNKIAMQIFQFGINKRFVARWWHSADNTFYVYNITEKETGITVPPANSQHTYINPDFSNYKKLINKLKTILVFS